MSEIKEINRRLMARVADRGFVMPLDRIECADGFSISVQASKYAYCTPRCDQGPWDAFELGYPSAPDDLIQAYAETPDRPTETVYGYVPAEVVGALINHHGGFR